ncbi:hypothetical protein E6Q11_05210 [Candidatus Dojkabacteria bacterium]|uniref:Uncharacterized protein n=1 Tax=Candidatus Dojkabacteria bacterium TaxID=2099670 RepID=A0A5C7J3U0_9BACT|nr:MAG: hypothetical protein E6Q11_05210 [Candidatus Dojkabacteria bacterium]
MNKFVQIQGYPDQFFMVISNKNDLPNGFEESASKRLITVLGKDVIYGDKEKKHNCWEKFKFASENQIDYGRILDKYGRTLLIREIGSWMFLNKDHVIEKIVMSDYWPVQSDAKIVVCENDYEAETEWINYLNTRFPKQQIDVINFFSTRDKDEIKERFKSADYITFSTTFTSYEWFNTVLELCEGKKIIGYCHDINSWPTKLDSNVEIVESLM